MRLESMDWVESISRAAVAGNTENFDKLLSVVALLDTQEALEVMMYACTLVTVRRALVNIAPNGSDATTEEYLARYFNKDTPIFQVICGVFDMEVMGV